MKELTDEQLLNKYGWTVECESPFEISTEDGSFASMEAAYIVLGDLRGRIEEETSDSKLDLCGVISRTSTSEPLEDNIVIVVDNSNYKASFAENCPFKARVIEKTDNEIWVQSLITEKKYELYYGQILETFDISKIKNLLNMSKYGL